MNSLISLSDGEFSRRPGAQLSSGYAARKFFSAPVMSLPPDVAKNITVLPFRLWLSMKVLMILGAVFHHIGKPI